MRETRRMKRMERNNRKGEIRGLGINLIPMMDVLCVLVFFLLFHSFNSTMPDAQIALPASVVETKPRETVAIVVSPETVMVQGESVISTPKLLEDSSGIAYEIRARLEQIDRNIIETGAKTFAEGKEVTLLADKTIPFKVLKKIMSTCTASGYGKISLAVVQKEEHKEWGCREYNHFSRRIGATERTNRASPGKTQGAGRRVARCRGRTGNVFRR